MKKSPSLTTTPRGMPYSSWFRPTAILLTVAIEDLGGDLGRSEATSVTPRYKNYLGTSRTLPCTVPGVRAHLREEKHQVALMMRWTTSLVQSSLGGMGQVLSFRLRQRIHLCLLLVW